MICKVIEGEEEISCPPCHEWNTCKTQQRHNHFHVLLKVFSEYCKCIFSTCTLVSPHICDICQQHLKRNTFQQQESNLCRFKILVKVCCSFQKPSTQKDLSSQSYCQSVMHFYFCVLYFFLSISVQLFDWMFNKEQPLGTLALCLVLWCRYMFRGFQQLSFGYLLTMINRITRYSAALYLQTLTCSHGITEWG